MRVRNLLSSFTFVVLSLGILVGCDIVKEGGLSYPFTIDVNVVDGEMYVDGVLRRPSMSFTAVSEDSKAVYDMVYSVDGEDEKWLRGLPISKSWNIDSDLAGFDTYGEHEVRGRVILESDTRRSVSFSAKFWMKYAAVDVTRAYFSFPKGRVELSNDSELMTGSSGDLVIEYSPSRSYAEITAKTISDGVLRLDSSKQTNEGGVFSIPFVVEGEGVSDLSFVFRNGTEEMEISYRITCGYDKGYDDLILNFESRDLVLPGVPLDVNLEVLSGDMSRLFNVDYFIDGTAVGSDESVSLSPAAAKNLDWTGLSVGAHKVGVKVSLVGGRGLPLEREATFIVADPALSVTGGAYAGTVIHEGGSLTLDAGTDYVLSVTGVPDAFADRFRMDCDPASLSEIGDGLWSFSAKSYGKDALKFIYSYDGNDVRVATIDVFGLSLSVRDFVIPGLSLDVTLGVSSGNSQALFDVDFFIDGALSVSEKGVSLSPAVTRSLDWSSLAVGTHTVSVKASPVDGTGVALEREESFEVADPSLSVTGGGYNGMVVKVGGSLTLDAGSDYALALNGVSDTFASRFVARSDHEAVKMTGMGRWSFTPKVNGKEVLRLVYSHAGSEASIASFDVVGVDLSVRNFVIPGLLLDVKLGVSFGDSSSLFDADFYIDGKLVSSEKGISLSPAVTRSIDWSSVSAGNHKLSVKVRPVGGSGNPLEREATFTVSDPALSVTGGLYFGTSVKTGGSLTLDAASDYSLSLTGVPDGFIGRFKLVGDVGSISSAGSGKWSYTPRKYGKDVVKFMYSYDGSEVHIASFDAVRLDFSAGDFVMKGLSLESRLSANFGESSGLFDVDYYIDGKLILSERGVGLATAVSKTFDWSSLSVGTHKLSVKVSLDGGHGLPLQREGSFDISVPGLVVTGGDYSDVSVSDGSSFTFAAGTDYVFTLTGVRDAFARRFVFECEKASLSKASDGCWTVNPNSFGKEIMKFSYSHGDSNLAIASFNVLRTDVCDVTLAWHYEANSSYLEKNQTVSECFLGASVQGKYALLVELPITGKVYYHGHRVYPEASKAFKPTDQYYNQKKEESTSSQSDDISGTVSSAISVSVLDIKSRVQNLIGLGRLATYWTRWSIEEGSVIYDVDFGPEAESKSCYFFYDLVLESVSLDAITKYEGLSYRLHLDGIGKRLFKLGDGWTIVADVVD